MLRGRPCVNQKWNKRVPSRYGDTILATACLLVDPLHAGELSTPLTHARKTNNATLIQQTAPINHAVYTEHAPNLQQHNPSEQKLRTLPLFHRATYAISLDNRNKDDTAYNDLAQVTGHATIEIRPTVGGYIRNVTFVLHVYPVDQPMQTIMKSFAIMEASDGRSMTFRVNTRSELGEDVVLKGEGVTQPQSVGFVKSSVETEDHETESEGLDLNVTSSVIKRLNLPAGTIFPIQLLLCMMNMATQESHPETNIFVYDPYWSSVYKMDIMLVHYQQAAGFKILDDTTDRVKEKLSGQKAAYFVCGFYAPRQEPSASSPQHQMLIEMLPCGVITQWSVEDPSIGEQIKLTLKHIELLS